MRNKVFAVLAAIAIALVAFALSWAVTAFVYWLITLCFGIEWSILHATGYWLILILITSCFNGIKVQLKN